MSEYYAEFCEQKRKAQEYMKGKDWKDRIRILQAIAEVWKARAYWCRWDDYPDNWERFILRLLRYPFTIEEMKIICNNTPYDVTDYFRLGVGEAFDIWNYIFVIDDFYRDSKLADTEDFYEEKLGVNGTLAERKYHLFMWFVRNFDWEKLEMNYE